MNDDSALYTGVDGDIITGAFGNEVQDEAVKQLADEQDRLIKELTPQLEDILDMLESEKKDAIKYITAYVTKTKDDDTVYRGELKAAALYSEYIDGLKTKFTLALNEVKK